ncbi:unnamed protein product, partial [Discosporangium mesarthrocarpum]
PNPKDLYTVTCNSSALKSSIFFVFLCQYTSAICFVFSQSRESINLKTKKMAKGTCAYITCTYTLGPRAGSGAHREGFRSFSVSRYNSAHTTLEPFNSSQA